MIGERKGKGRGWCVTGSVGEPVGRGDDPPNSHQKSPT
jgi:hypothetical protein